MGTRRLLTVVLLAALIWPAIRNRDGLPLSTYPMYSSTRTDESTYATASGFDADGERLRLSALVISGSRDRLIAQSFLNDAVGRGDADAACVDIASRVEAPVVTVEIARERHNTIARLRGEPSLVWREVYAACEVPQ